MLVISAANSFVHNGRGILSAVKDEDEDVAVIDDTVEAELGGGVLLPLRLVVLLLLLRFFGDDEDETPTAAVKREREREEEAKDAMEPTELEGVIIEVEGVVLEVTNNDGGIENSLLAAAATDDRCCCGCCCGCSTLSWWLDHWKFLLLPCIIYINDAEEMNLYIMIIIYAVYDLAMRRRLCSVRYW